MASAHNLPLALDRAYRTGFFRVDDPGASGEIGWSNKGHAICPVTTAAAESRTIQAASGYGVGTRLLVVLYEDGGDLTIATGDTEDVVLGTAGQAAEFIVVEKEVGSTISKEWRVLSIPVDQVARAEIIPDAEQETIAAGTGGAISVATYLTLIDGDAGGDAFTLADGTVTGQLKKIVNNGSAAGNAVVTLTTAADENTLTFDAVGETALLRWNGTAWRIIQAYNEATAGAGPTLSTV